MTRSSGAAWPCPLLALLAVVVVPVAFAAQAPAPAPAPSRPASASAPAPPPSAPPEPTLGAHAPALEGTWELVSMRLPDGTVLEPPIASGVIVVDKGAYLAASYVQPTSVRKVGSIWDGQLVIEGDRFRLVPRTGYRYDSMAQQRVHPEIPPPARGTITRTQDALVLEKDGGGTITFPAGANRRRQEDPDGTVIEHVRTSLVPRVPEDLPGRPAPGARP